MEKYIARFDFNFERKANISYV